MAKVAIELERALTRRQHEGGAGKTDARVIARGDGWSVADVICTCGRGDLPFEECHHRSTIAVVLAGTFQYRSSVGRGLMTPGSLMLGNAGQGFECAHEHGDGDRCFSFWYAPEYLEQNAADALPPGRPLGFRSPSLPPLPSLSSVIAQAAIGVIGVPHLSWEELGLKLAVTAIGLDAGASPEHMSVPRNAEARVTRSVRTIDRHPDAALTLDTLSRGAGLSRYHFLRTFERATGLTPHQYVRRARLREAAVRLASEPDTVLDIALDCGFGDISAFNRAFRTEFDLTPRAWRRSIASPATST